MPRSQEDIRVDDELTISDEEVSFVTSRSSGPGGQNVNKVESRVTLRFDVGASKTLRPDQKARLRERLATRINRLGILQVSAQRQRTQAGNRRLATERFVELLGEALKEAAPRLPTPIPGRIHRRRLQEKRRTGETKRLRRRPLTDDE